MIFETQEESFEIMKEKEEERIPWYIIRFNSRFRVYWDLFIILLAIYNCILIPIDVGFGEKFYGSHEKAIGTIDSVLDLFFFMDFIFNFVTTYISPKSGTEVSDSKRIAKAYVKTTSCYIDLLATIPFDQIAILFFRDSNLDLSFFGVLKLVRLLRLRRIVTFLKVNQSFQFGIRLIQTIGMLVLVVHWFACIWYLIVIT